MFLNTSFYPWPSKDVNKPWSGYSLKTSLGLAYTKKDLIFIECFWNLKPSTANHQPGPLQTTTIPDNNKTIYGLQAAAVYKCWKKDSWAVDVLVSRNVHNLDH